MNWRSLVVTLAWRGFPICCRVHVLYASDCGFAPGNRRYLKRRIFIPILFEFSHPNSIYSKNCSHLLAPYKIRPPRKTVNLVFVPSTY